MEFMATLNRILEDHGHVIKNPDRAAAIRQAVESKEAFIAANGCLATWISPDSTGRAPNDTLIVRNPGSEKNIDWDSPNNLPIDPETFEMLWEDALKVLENKKGSM